MGCQKHIAENIQGAGADYLLAVKDNQPTLDDTVLSDANYVSDFRRKSLV